MDILVHMGTFFMTREDIIRMAREVGLPHWYETEGVVNEELLIKFATLVAQLERERIAKKLEQLPFGDTAASFAIYVRES
jgi:hypothetical protein